MSHTDETEAAGTELVFTDTLELQTDGETLWETISNPEVLTACIPGAESVERVSERKYTVDITRGISKLTVSLSGDAEFLELNPPEHIVTRGSAFDSKTGSSFDVLAAMEMTDTGDAVALSYKAEVSVSGGVTSVGTDFLRPIIERDVDSYFENIRARVEPPDGTG